MFVKNSNDFPSISRILDKGFSKIVESTSIDLDYLVIDVKLDQSISTITDRSNTENVIFYD